MKKTVVPLVLVILAISSGIALYTGNTERKVEYIPTEQTAVNVSKAIWQGMLQLDSADMAFERNFHAVRVHDVWKVRSKLDTSGKYHQRGIFAMDLNAKSAEVLYAAIE